MTMWLWACLVLVCLAAFIEVVKRAGVIEVPKIRDPLDGPEKPDHEDDTPKDAGHKPEDDNG